MVVSQMIEAVKGIDPLYVEEMDDPIPLEETTEYKFFQNVFSSNSPYNKSYAKEFLEEFDDDMNGRYSRLVGFNENASQILASAVRAVVGASKSRLSDEEAVKLVLSPLENHHLLVLLHVL